MIAALILVFALAALAHFGLNAWRSWMTAMAAEPLSDKMFAAARDNSLGARDFGCLSSLSDICPDLGEPGSRLRLARAYYWGVRALDRLSSILLPSATAWTQQELSLCARFVAVEIDRRLQRNRAYLAEIRSF